MIRRLVEVLAAFAVGLALGVLYAWVISPTRYVDTTPATLRADFKDQFRTAISAAYAATGNLDRARARLILLGDPDPVQALTAQAQRMLATGQPFSVAQQVAQLATDLASGIASVALGGEFDHVFFIEGGSAKLRDSDIQHTELEAAGFDTDRSFMVAEVSGEKFQFETIARTGQLVDSGIVERNTGGVTRTQDAR